MLKIKTCAQKKLINLNNVILLYIINMTIAIVMIHNNIFVKTNKVIVTVSLEDIGCHGVF